MQVRDCLNICIFWTSNYLYFSVVLDFLNQTVVYMDSLTWIERYAWFALFVSSVIFFIPVMGTDLYCREMTEHHLTVR